MRTSLATCIACAALLPWGTSVTACRSEEVNLRIDEAAIATGRIVGIVQDRQTERPLDFANVIVVGTTLGCMSRNAGRFAVDRIPPGVYQLRASLVRFAPQTLADVQVEANATTVVRFCLERSVDPPPKIIVRCRERPRVKVSSIASSVPIRSEGSPSRSVPRNLEADRYAPRPTETGHEIQVPVQREILALPVASGDGAVNLPRGVPPTLEPLRLPSTDRLSCGGVVVRRGPEPTFGPEIKIQLSQCGCGKVDPAAALRARPGRIAGSGLAAGVVPKVTRLQGNYPNPFNPSTRIQFDLAHRGRVALAIFDARGRRVRTLVSREMEPGQRAVVWDGKDDAGRSVASGMYVYRLVTESFRDSRKLIVVR